MSRVAQAETIAVRASNNIYTGLLAVATVATALGLVEVVLKYKALFGGYPFGF